MIKWLGAIEVERVVFEATGAYHRLFERTLAEARLPVVKVNRAMPAASPKRSASSPRPIDAVPPRSPEWGRRSPSNPLPLSASPLMR